MADVICASCNSATQHNTTQSGTASQFSSPQLNADRDSNQLCAFFHLSGPQRWTGRQADNQPKKRDDGGWMDSEEGLVRTQGSLALLIPCRQGRSLPTRQQVPLLASLSRE